MNKDLEKAFNKLVENLKNDPRCKGGWHYGSVGRGMSDEYSDYDPVFLVADKDFEGFASDVARFVSTVSDELVVHWPENYNDGNFKNFCNLIRLGENLHQMDFFILNADRTDAWFCKQHLKGCTRENIIFDRAGEVGELLDKGLRTDNYIPDPVRTMDTYWFHVEMLIKYFKRKDIFKLVKNIQEFLFHVHVDLLLSRYDTLDWGAWESKVKHCVPLEKQEHLKAYFTRPDFEELKNAIRKAMLLFRQDSEEVCMAKGLSYPGKVADQVISYFDKQLSEAY